MNYRIQGHSEKLGFFIAASGQAAVDDMRKRRPDLATTPWTFSRWQWRAETGHDILVERVYPFDVVSELGTIRVLAVDGDEALRSWARRIGKTLRKGEAAAVVREVFEHAAPAESLQEW